MTDVPATYRLEFIEDPEDVLILTQDDVDVLLDAGLRWLSQDDDSDRGGAKPTTVVAEMHVLDGAAFSYRGRLLDEQEMGRLLSAGLSAALRARLEPDKAAY